MCVGLFRLLPTLPLSITIPPSNPHPTSMSAEQLIHDEVNLIRLLRRLEKSTSTGSWLEDLHEATAWIRSQNLVQVSTAPTHLYGVPPSDRLV